MKKQGPKGLLKNVFFEKSCVGDIILIPQLLADKQSNADAAYFDLF